MTPFGPKLRISKPALPWEASVRSSGRPAPSRTLTWGRPESEHAIADEFVSVIAPRSVPEWLNTTVAPS